MLLALTLTVWGPLLDSVTAEEEENRSNARQLLWLDGLKDISVVHFSNLVPDDRN